MSADTWNEDWAWGSPTNDTDNPTLQWTTSISRSRVSTVDGLRFSENVDSAELNSLEGLLHTVQQLKIKRFRVEELEDQKRLACGETFDVAESKHQGKLVVIKHIRLYEDGKSFDRPHFQRRLQSVLREILIMHHQPVAFHPNVLSLLGYGWTVGGERLVPFVVVEFASGGSLRKYLQERTRTIRDKMILMGDVAAGVSVLHKCGIVHGDLKADNVVVFFSLERPSMAVAKISDFGHSILVGSTPEKLMRYFGTSIYNAPEVARQRDWPIPAEQLHKCDIWAFGLCVWEILADGEVYKQLECLQIATSSSLFTQTASPSSSTSPKSSQGAPIHPTDQVLSENSVLDRLNIIAIEFLDSVHIPGIGFEKGFLRPLLKSTLHVDPNQRTSDLSRFPIFGFWSKESGGASLQSKLATYALSEDFRYSIFSREDDSYIIWDQQRQLLQDFEAEAQRVEPSKKKGDASAVFQTMLCYVNGFGTSRDLSKAAQFLGKSQETGHLLAQILGARILDGVFGNSCETRMQYNECLAHGFRLTGEPEQSPLILHSGEFTTQLANYNALREAFIVEDEATTRDKEDLIGIIVTMDTSSESHSLLEIAIHHGDVEFVDILMSRLEGGTNALESSIGSCLVQAARHAHGAIVNRILREKINLFLEDVTELLHWLFCLDHANIYEAQMHLQERIPDSELEAALRKPTTCKIKLHPQWPFQIYGTPLATAIASGSVDAVKVLLHLKADPLAPAFESSDDDLPQMLTPIHLAVRYHSPNILKLLWKAAFGQTEIVASQALLKPELRCFPIACTLSFLTNAERFAIHGGNYLSNLRELIGLLPQDLLTQGSYAGKNALTQAIDLEDTDTLNLILERYPRLALERLFEPADKNVFTYPLHFAVQAGSSRDTDESIQILESIFKLDPTAIDRPDSSSVKPLHIAAKGTSPRVTEWLLMLGVSCNQVDGRGRNALHFCRSSEIAKGLLLRGAKLNHKDHFGAAPIHAAAIEGTESVLQVLVGAGADLSLDDNGLGTPLHCAVHQKSLPMMKSLLEACAKVDAVDLQGRTPLYVAMGTGRWDVVSLLLEHGADPFVEHRHASSPFRLALTWKNAIILNSFLKHSKFRTLSWDSKVQALGFAAKNGEPAPLRQYLHQLLGPSLNSSDPTMPRWKDIITCINTAASACRADLVDVFLAHGFKIDTIDSKANTPLILACLAGHTEPRSNPYIHLHLCEKLIHSGADILAQNGRGLTPLEIAKGYSDYTLLTLLLEHAIELRGSNLPVRQEQLYSSFRDNREDERFCQEARKHTNGWKLDPEFLSDAALDGEWELIMTYIGGHFITSFELRANFKAIFRYRLAQVSMQNSTGAERDATTPTGKPDSELDPDNYYVQQASKVQANATRRNLDMLDVLRLFCLRQDRDMVRYIYSEFTRSLNIVPRFVPLHNATLRNLKTELSYTIADLNETLWDDESPTKPRLDPIDPVERARVVAQAKKNSPETSWMRAGSLHFKQLVRGKKRAEEQLRGNPEEKHQDLQAQIDAANADAAALRADDQS